MESSNSMKSVDKAMRAIEVYTRINKRSPSIRDVANLSGLSKSWAHECVVRLWSAKRIKYKPSERRSIEINP
jgi:DNA-binding IclR family transcriptional regulator